MTLEIIDDQPPKYRKGYLRFKCRSCARLVKTSSDNPRLYLMRVSANDGDNSIGIHDCDQDRMGVTDLIGCTFEAEGQK